MVLICSSVTPCAFKAGRTFCDIWSIRQLARALRTCSGVSIMTWGADAYVIKSSDLTELKQKIREVLDKRKKSKKP